MPFVRWFLDIGNTIYVHRGEADREALALASAVLKAGGMLGIAPEGTRSRSGGLARGHSGMVRLAAESGAAIVPVAACGQEHIVANLKRLRRTRVRVRIGAPLTVSLGDRSAVRLQAETERVMRALAALLPPSYRGVYAEAEEERVVASV
jgi:1-acyl-sn-glycerol-3-phosphate acyltransferase